MSWKRFLFAGALMSALTLTPAAALTVHIEGHDLSASSFLENGTTYVSLRAAAQKLGEVAVTWEDGTAQVAADGFSLTARPGDKWLEANGRGFYVKDGVLLRNGSVMVPVRVLANAMGGSVHWDSSSRVVRVFAGTGAVREPGYDADDLYWLSRIISAESRGEPMDGKLAVGTVVLNRVASADFPDTIYDVIFDRKWGVQFTPVSNGSIYNEPTQESVAAAKLVLEGVRVAGNSLYFLAPAQASSNWAVRNRPYVTTIGSHQFYA